MIAKAGRPVARLMPLMQDKPKRVLGLGGGQFKVPDDFDRPLPDDLLDLFYGTGKDTDRLFLWDEPKDKEM